MPILYKRLRIQGSTLRSRTVKYQADLIARLANFSKATIYVAEIACCLEDLIVRCFRNLQEETVTVLSGFISTRFIPDFSLIFNCQLHVIRFIHGQKSRTLIERCKKMQTGLFGNYLRRDRVYHLTVLTVER